MRRLLGNLLKALTASAPAVNDGRARLEFDLADTIVYAIGDVHGCMEQLRKLEAMIAEDAKAFEAPKLIVMLGDYVDRGPQSAEVLDHLTMPPPAGFKRICLAGNHEVAMLGFLEDPLNNLDWLSFGGLETIRSYGVDVPEEMNSRGELKAVLDEFFECVPASHRRFLKMTAMSLVLGEYLFVHAGVRPGVPLADQAAADMLWIRNDFLRVPVDIGYTVVHGHTPVDEPEIAPSRISVDTGVYHSRRLSAVRLNAGPPKVFMSDRVPQVVPPLEAAPVEAAPVVPIGKAPRRRASRRTG